MAERQLFARNAVIKSITPEDIVGKHVALYKYGTKIAEGEVSNFRFGLHVPGRAVKRRFYDASIISLKTDRGFLHYPATAFTHIEFVPPLDESNEDNEALLDDIRMAEKENVYYSDHGGARRTKTYKKKRTNRKSSKKSRKPKRKTSKKRL